MLKKNVIYNYIGQFYNSFIGILIFPLYLKYIGGEAYGLIGFFMLLQAWMLLFDLGMSPTLARQVAISKIGEETSNELRSLLRSLETVFLIIALVIFILMFSLKGNIASKWLNVSTLDINDVAICIALMGAMISLRWFASLYKSGINGYERQAWVNVFNITVVTFRMPFSLIIIFLFKNSIVAYFVYQFLVSIFEVYFLNRKMYFCLPEKGKAPIPIFSWQVLSYVLPFAASTAYTAGIWVFLTQLDKLLLSKILPLNVFGYFSMIATLVGGILMLSTPVSNALLPRMTNLLSRGYEEEMLELYRMATRFICCVVSPISMVMCFFPFLIMFVWTGNSETSRWAVSILPQYAIGNAILAIVGFQYYLQYAHGKLKLHVLYNSLLALISIPAVYFSAIKFGAIGTGFVWLIFNMTTMFFWTALVHKKFAPGLHKKWIFFDVFIPILPSLVIFILLWAVFKQNSFTRVEGGGFIISSCIISFAISIVVAFYSKIIAFLKFKK
ncbi:oligosaccharide flippase family protein [Obesumbacterium proteus]|uniref:oligosaccharide flippase family protein n=1 Tax=Obesumbacterium proteus TaxID=82983 RepID=UPI00242DB724|nr:oligosaccharide flippase family protein [Obesumbacterium proteus]